jgi:hypothetical protein
MKRQYANLQRAKQQTPRQEGVGGYGASQMNLIKFNKI